MRWRSLVLAFAVLSAPLAASTTVLAETSGCSGEDACPIRSDARVTSPLRCTLNWVFDGSGGNTYEGTAGHCADEGDQAHVRGVEGAIGEVVWRLGGRFSGTDFSLIQIEDEQEARVEATTAEIGGPTQVYRSSTRTTVLDGDPQPVPGRPEVPIPSAALPIALHGHGIGWSEDEATRDRAGHLYRPTPTSYELVAPVTPGDSGGPIQVAGTGQAVGIVSANAGELGGESCRPAIGPRDRSTSGWPGLGSPTCSISRTNGWGSISRCAPATPWTSPGSGRRTFILAGQVQAGVSFPPEPDESAIVVLVRDGEVYLVERPRSASFFPGFYAFPGGGVEDEDERDGELARLRACAARELAEETRVEVDEHELTPAGRVVTPPFSPIRYETQFFTVAVDEDVEPAPVEPELAGGAWFDPAEATEAWEERELKLPPPVLRALRLLAEDGRAGLEARGEQVDDFPIEFVPGVRVEPLETGTLPPHTHTNGFVVGDDELAVVDPGASGDALEPLRATLDTLTDEGRQVRHVVLTHHHEDHAAGARDIANAHDAEIVASPATAKRLDVAVDRTVGSDEVVRVGDHTLWAVGTPGHAPGHTAWLVEEAGTLLAGDLVAGIGTVLVPPDEGDMAAYIDSLKRAAETAREQGVALLFPAHGPPSFDPVGKLEGTREHRLEREARVRDAVEAGHEALEAIAEAAYEDKPDAPDPLKRSSTRAHLDKLEADDAVARTEDGWQAA
jgi:glyoxylase-like metal-dependent hydrolase (beta-lactamase superfamily II)/8-oxo-dGTP pyrophosphatase MutT (NUDIX family)